MVEGFVTRIVDGNGRIGASATSYARHQFPPDMIRHAVGLYLRFALSYRDFEELVGERGLDISCETIGHLLSLGVRVKCDGWAW